MDAVMEHKGRQYAGGKLHAATVPRAGMHVAGFTTVEPQPLFGRNGQINDNTIGRHEGLSDTGRAPREGPLACILAYCASSSNSLFRRVT